MRPFGRRHRPPDFVGVGAEGAGGAWWLDILLAHPGIEAPRRRSLDFFGAVCERPLTRRDAARYCRLFPRPRAGVLRGEWTERYMADAWTPPALALVAPEARLLVMLRNPVEIFRQAMAARLATQDTSARWYTTDILDRACHAGQLRHLWRYFPSERVLVLQLERCLADPLGELRRTEQFLGLPPAPRPPAIPPLPERRHGRAELWPDLEASLHDALDDEVRALAELVPDLDLELWPPFAHLAPSPSLG